MRVYYAKLKSMEEYISFIFVTGITRNAHLGILTKFNSYRDITTNPQFGAICGFTQRELRRYFGPHITQTANTLSMTEEELLKKMESYYNGFCFDGVTKVYNPFSTLSFFQDQKFNNYWFKIGIPSILANFLNKQRLTVEQFSGEIISEDFANDPGDYSESDPLSYLYQSGYLCLRDGPTDDTYLLDYPNREVREAMSRLLVTNFYGRKVVALYTDLKGALANGDAPKVIKIFNNFLAKVPYDDYTAAKVKTAGELNQDEVISGEFLYRSSLLSLLYGSGALVFPEVHGNRGRPDMIVASGKVTWVMEIKVCQSDDKEQKALSEARAQIIAQGYPVAYPNPICLGIVINEQKRSITLWENFGSLAEETKAKQNTPRKKSPKATKPKA
jgi:hypothetical protein